MSTDEKDDELRKLVQRSRDAQEAVQAFALKEGIDALTDSTGHSTLMRGAQEALVGANNRFRRLVARMSALIVELAPDGAVLWISDAVTGLLGYRPVELTRSNFWTRVLPSDQSDQVTDFMAKVAAGDVLNHQLHLTTQSGSRVIFEVTTANHYRWDGGLERIVAFCVDVTGRVEVEARVRRSEQRFRRLFDSKVAGFYHADTNGPILEANDTFLGMIGYTAADVAAGLLRWDTLTAPKDLAGSRVALVGLLRGNEIRSFEKEYLHKDGHPVPVVVGVAMLDRDSSECMVVVLDNSERMRQREALVASEARFKQLADSMPQMVWSASPDGTVDYYNDRWYDFTGGERGRTGDESWVPLFHPDDAQMVADHWYAAVRSENAYELEFRIRDRKTGGYRWFLSRALPVRDAGGKVVRWYGTLTDIEEKRTTEERLRRQVSRTTLLNDINHAVARRHDLYSILHVVLRYLENDYAVDVGVVYFCDLKSRTVTVAALGTKAGQGAATDAFPEGSVIPLAETGVAECLAGRSVYVSDVSQGSRAMALHFVGRDIGSLVGVPLVVEDSVLGVLVAKRRAVDGFTPEDRSFLEALTGHVALAVHQARLNEDLKTAYETLRRTQEQVVQQERLRALGQMASGIAHDFNNALSPILGFADILLERPEDLARADVTRRYLKMMHTAAQDGARVVSRLKEFYRHREENEVFQPVNLNEVARETISLTEPRWKGQAQARGADIQVQSDLAKQVQEFPGNESDLRELLTNLIFNAVDAMPRGGTIVVRTREVLDGVILEVSDTGTGMTEEVRRRCLEPFFTTKGDEGTGLGLSMVHGIVRRHEGAIEIESEVGKGTTFRIRFPVKATAQLQVDAYKPPRRMGKLSVLVVDDNDQVRELLMAFLNLDGHEMETASDGEEGLAKFVSGKFDVVITDRAMPRMSGDQLATAIRAFSPDAKVILLTGFGEFMDASGEHPRGVDLIVSKPVTLGVLRQALAKVTGRK